METIKVDNLVLGAGPSGLSTACQLKNKGEQFILLEGSERVGGNCFTFWENGYGFDSGAHRLHDKNEEVSGWIKGLLKKDLFEINLPSKIYSRGDWFSFPIKPMEVLNKLSVSEKIRVLGDQLSKRKNGYSFGHDVDYKFGKTIGDRFLHNYSKKLWGESTYDLLPEVSGKRLGKLSFISLLRELIFGIEPEHIDGRFYYPKNGIYQIFQTIGDLVNSHIKFNEKVIAVSHDDYGFRVKTTKTIYISKHLYSSLPLSFLTDFYSGDIMFNYRHLKLVFIALDTESISNCATLYFPEEEYVFTRITEPKNRSKYLCPNGKTSIAVEIPYFSKDTYEEMSDEDLIALVKKQLPEFIPIDKELFSCVKTLKNAYPVLDSKSKKEVLPVIEELRKVRGLHLIGRVGQFEYLHIHDLLSQQV